MNVWRISNQTVKRTGLFSADMILNMFIASVHHLKWRNSAAIILVVNVLKVLVNRQVKFFFLSVKSDVYGQFLRRTQSEIRFDIVEQNGLECGMNVIEERQRLFNYDHVFHHHVTKENNRFISRYLTRNLGSYVCAKISGSVAPNSSSANKQHSFKSVRYENFTYFEFSETLT